MTRTPRDHYRAADQLLAEVDEVGSDCLNLAFIRAKIAKAAVHAALAECPAAYGIEAYGYQPPRQIRDAELTGDAL